MTRRRGRGWGWESSERLAAGMEGAFTEPCTMWRQAGDGRGLQGMMCQGRMEGLGEPSSPGTW